MPGPKDREKTTQITSRSPKRKHCDSTAEKKSLIEIYFTNKLVIYNWRAMACKRFKNLKKKLCFRGDSDVGDIVMLVT